MNRELSDVHIGLRGRWTRDQTANIHWITEKAREFQKNICFIDYAKAFVWITTTVKNSERDGNTRTSDLPPEKPACRKNQTWNNRLVPNWERSTSRLYIAPCLFKLYAEYIMWNARLDESQAGIKTARGNTHNFRYADDTTLMAESKEELKSLLMKAKEESEKPGLKRNIFKKLISWHLVPSLHGEQMGKKMETVTDFIFLGSWITVDSDCSHEIKDTCSLKEKLRQT